MTDVHSKEIRSFNMRQVKSKDTKPEMIVRRHLHSIGYRFRLHAKDLPGKPDIVLPKYKTVVFIHGCFWHGHKGCKRYTVPKTRADWWLSKINYNIENDRKVIIALSDSGWKIINLWECELRADKLEKTLDSLPERILS